MFTQNDWLLKREAEERMKARLSEAEAYKLAKLTRQTKQKQPVYQRSLVRLGEWMSRTGDFLQIHFGAGLQVETNCFCETGSVRE